jgi:hypothetical protein
MAIVNKGEAFGLLYDAAKVTTIGTDAAADVVMALAAFSQAEMLDWHNRARVLCGMDPLPYGSGNSEVDDNPGAVEVDQS